MQRNEGQRHKGPTPKSSDISSTRSLILRVFSKHTLGVWHRSGSEGCGGTEELSGQSEDVISKPSSLLMKWGGQPCDCWEIIYGGVNLRFKGPEASVGCGVPRRWVRCRGVSKGKWREFLTGMRSLWPLWKEDEWLGASCVRLYCAGQEGRSQVAISMVWVRVTWFRLRWWQTGRMTRYQRALKALRFPWKVARVKSPWHSGSRTRVEHVILCLLGVTHSPVCSRSPDPAQPTHYSTSDPDFYLGGDHVCVWMCAYMCVHCVYACVSVSMCVCVSACVSVCICMCICVCVCVWWPEEGLRSPGVGVTGTCEPPDMGAGTWPQFLWESSKWALWTAEPVPQPLFLFTRIKGSTCPMEARESGVQCLSYKASLG